MPGRWAPYGDRGVTEEIAATPGWVEARLDEAFAPLPASQAITAARTGYAACLAKAKQPGAPSDLLGAEFQPCRAALIGGLAGLEVGQDARDALERRLEAIEAELAIGS